MHQFIILMTHFFLMLYFIYVHLKYQEYEFQLINVEEIMKLENRQKIKFSNLEILDSAWEMSMDVKTSG